MFGHIKLTRRTGILALGLAKIHLDESFAVVQLTRSLGEDVMTKFVLIAAPNVRRLRLPTVKPYVHRSTPSESLGRPTGGRQWDAHSRLTLRVQATQGQSSSANRASSGQLAQQGTEDEDTQ